MLINCVIIEDEPLATERLIGYIEKLPYLRIAGTFESAIEASANIDFAKVELVFLDIHLGEVSGIQFLQSIKIKSEVVLTTAFHQYAIDAFDVGVADYLLKPYSFERFLTAVSRAQERILKAQKPKDIQHIFIKSGIRLEKVLISEILYIEGMRDYRKIVTQQKPVMTLQTFSELEEWLPSTMICRVHKSFMVAIDKISSIENDTLSISGKDIPISDTYKSKFMAMVRGR